MIIRTCFILNSLPKGLKNDERIKLQTWKFNVFVNTRLVIISSKNKRNKKIHNTSSVKLKSFDFSLIIILSIFSLRSSLFILLRSTEVSLTTFFSSTALLVFLVCASVPGVPNELGISSLSSGSSSISFLIFAFSSMIASPEMELKSSPKDLLLPWRSNSKSLLLKSLFSILLLKNISSSSLFKVNILYVLVRNCFHFHQSLRNLWLLK